MFVSHSWEKLYLPSRLGYTCACVYVDVCACTHTHTHWKSEVASVSSVLYVFFHPYIVIKMPSKNGEKLSGKIYIKRVLGG